MPHAAGRERIDHSIDDGRRRARGAGLASSLDTERIGLGRLVLVEGDIDAGQIGLWGISQAGWIIPIAAAVSRGDVAFTIIVSGPTVSIAEENYYSELTGDDQMKPTNLSREEISRRLKEITPAGLDASAFRCSGNS